MKKLDAFMLEDLLEFTLCNQSVDIAVSRYIKDKTRFYQWYIHVFNVHLLSPLQESKRSYWTGSSCLRSTDEGLVCINKRLFVSYYEEKYDFIKDLDSPYDNAAFSHSAKSFLVVGQLLMGDSKLYTSPICPGSVPAEKLDQVQLLLFFKETINWTNWY